MELDLGRDLEFDLSGALSDVSRGVTNIDNPSGGGWWWYSNPRTVVKRLILNIFSEVTPHI